MLHTCGLRSMTPLRRCSLELIRSVDSWTPKGISRTFSTRNQKAETVISTAHTMRRHFSDKSSSRVITLEEVEREKFKARIGQVREQLSDLLQEINVKLYENPVYSFKTVTLETLINDQSVFLSEQFGEIDIGKLIEELASMEREMEDSQLFWGNSEKSKISSGKEKKDIFVAQFDILIMQNEVEKAYEYFKQLHKDPHLKHLVEEIEILDFLLRGFARRCDFSKIQEIWSLMDALNIKPTQNSYISVILSISNANSKEIGLDFNEIIRFNEIMKDLTQRGFQMDKVLDEGVFHFDDRSQFVQTLNMFLSKKGISLQKFHCDTDISISSEGNQSISTQLEKYLKRKKLKSPMGIAKLKKLVTSQMETELSCSIKIPSICEAKTHPEKRSSSLAAQLQSAWRTKITNVLQERKRTDNNNNLVQRKGVNLDIFIYSIPIPKLVDIILASAMKIVKDSETHNPSSRELAEQLGSEVMTSYHLHCKTVLDTTHAEEFRSGYDGYLEWFCDPKQDTKDARKTFENATKYNMRIKTELLWPAVIQRDVGKELLSLILKDIRILCDAKSVLFVGDYETSNGQALSDRLAFFKVDGPTGDVIKPHPSLPQFLSMDETEDLRFSPKDLPMVTPPLPSTCGYLFRSDTAATEFEGQVQDCDLDSLYFLEQIQDPVLDSLNSLGSIPWRINKDILKIASDLFTDEKYASLLFKAGLPIHPDKILPPVPSPAIRDILAQSKTPTGSERRELRDFVVKQKIYGQIKSECHSVWRNTLYQLSLANHFQENIIWFPHNMDFLPVPSYLNYMGNDLCRSLLHFSKGNSLGKAGFEWLKLHTVKLGGSKMPDSEENGLLGFEEMLPQILDSANNPLNGSGWWLESDKPWQTLSACREVRNALLHPGGPEKYVCPLRDVSLSLEYGGISSVYHLVLLYRRVCRMMPKVTTQDTVEELSSPPTIQKKDTTLEQRNENNIERRKKRKEGEICDIKTQDNVKELSSPPIIKKNDTTPEQRNQNHIERRKIRKEREICDIKTQDNAKELSSPPTIKIKDMTPEQIREYHKAKKKIRIQREKEREIY